MRYEKCKGTPTRRSSEVGGFLFSEVLLISTNTIISLLYFQKSHVWAEPPFRANLLFNEPASRGLLYLYFVTMVVVELPGDVVSPAAATAASFHGSSGMLRSNSTDIVVTTQGQGMSDISHGLPVKHLLNIYIVFTPIYIYIYTYIYIYIYMSRLI